MFIFPNLFGETANNIVIFGHHSSPVVDSQHALKPRKYILIKVR
jgi:hypothetical protein